jgi:molybdopterin-guanine dinucleotide biosynthesis protein A
MPVSKDAGIFVFGMFFAAFTGKATQHWRTPCTTVAAGKTKGLLTVDGKTFVERLLERFAPKVSAVLISANRHLDVYQTLAAPWHAQVLPDTNAGFHGPLAGILTGLQHTVTDWLLVLPCDAQVLPENLLEKLRACCEQTECPRCFCSGR